MVNLKVPSSNGVSCGPKMTAFQSIMSFSQGAPLTPERKNFFMNLYLKKPSQLHTWGRVFLKPLEIPHQPSSGWSRHFVEFLELFACFFLISFALL